MISPELIQKIRQIEIKTRKNVTELMVGNYHSVFRGQGIEFAEVAEYTYGDDVKNIDWNVSARSEEIFVKKYDEERELSVTLAVDVSASQDYGSRGSTKQDMALEVAAILAYSAMKNRDKVSLLLFSDQIELFLPAKKSRNHVLRVLREIATVRKPQPKTDIRVPLDYINRMMRRKSVVFLISDFMAGFNYDKPLKIAGSRHDLIALQIDDPIEKQFSKLELGPSWVEDIESGEQMLVDLGNPEFVRDYMDAYQKNQAQLTKMLRDYQVDFLRLTTGTSVVPELIRFFNQRHMKRAHPSRA